MSLPPSDARFYSKPTSLHARADPYYNECKSEGGFETKIYTSERRERQVSLYLAKLISGRPATGQKVARAPSSSGRPNFCGPSNGIERERAEFSADFCAPELTQKVCHPYNYGLVCAAAENPISLNQWTSPSSSFRGRKFLKFSKRRVQQVGIFT